MRFRLLGPVEAFRGDERVAIRQGRERTLLALLLYRRDDSVSTDRIIELLWHDPPDSARAQVQNLVSRLRRGGPFERSIETTATGYRFVRGDHELDLDAFRDDVGVGRQLVGEGRHGDALDAFTRALDRWRGTALEDCVEPMASRIRPVLAEEFLGAAEARFAAQLSLGDHDAVLAGVAGLLVEHPVREELYRLRMLALGAAGRRADAMESYRTAHRLLQEQLGIEPGAALRHLHDELRSGGIPRLRAPAPAARVPRQLPAAADVLVGREKVQSGVRDALVRPDPFTTRVVVLTGQGGIGKTAVAVNVAHAVAEMFPDGQLYADLRGSHTRPIDAHELTGRFLRDLGVPGAEVPADSDERAAAYRSMLATRRVLLVLDDVADAAQVRDLLPGTAGCAVIVTARQQLDALGATAAFRLSILDHPDAVELLGRLIGRDRVDGEQDAASALVELCGHLPLAVRIAGARLVARRDKTLGTWCDRLAGLRARLDELSVGDLDVRATIAMSYRSLTDDVRRTFRRLGLPEAGDLPAWVFAALVGRTDAEEVLDELVERNLVEPARADGAGQWRYRVHDLVHEFCRERVVADDPEPDRAAATIRVLRGWLALAVVASENLRHGGALEPVSGSADPPPTASDAARTNPLAWFEAERANLVTAVHTAAGLGMTALVSDLALRVIGFLHLRDYESEREAVTRAAIASWRDTDHADRKLFLLHRSLFSTLLEQDRFAELQSIADRAMTVANGLDDVARVEAADGLAIAAAMAGRMLEALRIYRGCVAAAERLDLPERVRRKSMWGVAWVLGQLGEASESARTSERYLPAECVTRRDAIQLFDYAEVLVDCGRLDEAEAALHRSLRTFHEVGDVNCAAHVERISALIDLRRRRPHRARERLAAVAAQLRELRDRNGVGEVTRALSDVARTTGEAERARALLGEAETIWRRLDSPVELARTLARSASAHRAVGARESAERCDEEWRAILGRLDLPETCLRLPAP